MILREDDHLYEFHLTPISDDDTSDYDTSEEDTSEDTSEVRIPSYEEFSDDTTNFVGSSEDIFSGLLYLEEKYNNLCSPKYIIRGTKMFFKHIGLNYNNSTKKIVDNNSEFDNLLIKCFLKPKIRFIIFHLLIWYGNTLAHANFIIIDKLKKTIERFDPHSIDDYNSMYLHINKYLKNIFEKSIEGYVYLPAYKNTSTFQAIQIESGKQHKQQKSTDPDGFCGAWCIWYADLRLQNPNIERDIIYDISIKYIKENAQSFTVFIRKYSKFISEITISGNVKNTVKKYNRNMYNRRISLQKRYKK